MNPAAVRKAAGPLRLPAAPGLICPDAPTRRGARASPPRLPDPLDNAPDCA